MNNLKSTNIHIISVRADRLENPNWSNDEQKLKIEDRITEDEVIDISGAIPYETDEYGYDLPATIPDDYEYKIPVSLKESLDRINSPDARTDFYKITEEKRDLLYSSSLPISLDILKLKRLFPRELYTANKKSGRHKTYHGDLFNKMEDDKIYTDAIINVTFDHALQKADRVRELYKKTKDPKEEFGIKTIHIIKNKQIMTIRELRRKFYEKGVTLRFGDSLVEYVKYKRSSSKAKEGSHLFIKKELKEKMNDWGAFGIYYDDTDENVPLAAIKAYESLTSSGIEKTVNIRPNEILLIDDVKNKVKIKANVTTERENGEIIAEDRDECEIENTIWDGQSLADTSLFGDKEPQEQKGMLLLRNSFFKSCGFNTNIQKWFDDKLDNKKEFIMDMFGRKVKRTDIKLITTPSSLKFLKFHDKFPGSCENEKKKNCYEKWLDTISDEFGICKHESASHFGEFNQLSYQMVNSLPLSEEEVGTLLEYDLRRIENMKNDIDYFKSTINLENPMSSPSDALMLMLLNANNKMWHTRMVKDYVKDKVDNYIANLRKGHIKVKGSDYAVLFGNPIEMLQYAVEGEIKEIPLKGKQIYCSKYKNGEELAGFRNPHITMGNVLVVENIYKEAFSTYFNLTDNIVISNAYDNDIMYRLQGQDYDSDTLLLCSDPILVKAAKACQNDKFRVPINGIVAENKERKYTLKDEVDIDHKTAQNKIGEIVNLSQILNSYYWDYDSKNHDGRYDGLLKEYYNQISILSSLSQIEIDRAKKDYETVVSKFLKKLRERKYNGEFLLKKREKSFKKDGLFYKSFLTINDFYLSQLNASIENGYTDSIALQGFEGMVIMYSRNEKNKKQIIKAVQRMIDEILDPNWRNIDDPIGKSIKIQLDENRTKVLKRLIDFFAIDERSALIRPKFMEYREEKGKYSFEYFETPMDHLQKIIDNIPRKRKTKTIDIIDIIPKPDFRKADNRQLPKIIIKICEKPSKYINALQFNRKKSNKEIKNSRIREAKEKAIQELKELKINDNTIRIILYRALSENKKYRVEKYSIMGRYLASWLYQAHQETFKKVIEMSKSK